MPLWFSIKSTQTCAQTQHKTGYEQTTNLIQWWVQTEDVIVTVLLPKIIIIPVNIIVRDPVKQIRQESVCLRLLQVKDGAGPASTGRVIHVDGLSLVGVLYQNQNNYNWYSDMVEARDDNIVKTADKKDLNRGVRTRQWFREEVQ